jgi:hypothetical protein
LGPEWLKFVSLQFLVFIKQFAQFEMINWSKNWLKLAFYNYFDGCRTFSLSLIYKRNQIWEKRQERKNTTFHDPATHDHWQGAQQDTKRVCNCRGILLWLMLPRDKPSFFNVKNKARILFILVGENQPFVVKNSMLIWGNYQSVPSVCNVFIVFIWSLKLANSYTCSIEF